MIDWSDYYKDRDSIMAEIQEIETALGSLKTYYYNGRNGAFALTTADFVERRCMDIKSMFRLRELQQDKELEDMHKVYNPDEPRRAIGR